MLVVRSVVRRNGGEKVNLMGHIFFEPNFQNRRPRSAVKLNRNRKEMSTYEVPDDNIHPSQTNAFDWSSKI
jgi:hypothetical protein